MYCFAQLYINAVLCATVSSKEIKGQRGDAFAMPPRYALRTIFDYRVEIISQGSNDATKCCTYYIFVKIPKRNWIYHLLNQQKVTFHYAEVLWERFGLNDLHFSKPYKLTYWIEYLKKL